MNEPRSGRHPLLITLAIGMALVSAALRCARHEQQERTEEAMVATSAAIERARRELAAAPRRWTAPPAPDLPPVELELAYGDDDVRIDVTGPTVSLPDGGRVELRARDWTYSGPILSMSVPSSMRLVATAEGVKLAAGNTTAEVLLIADPSSVDASLATMAAAFTGVATSIEPIGATLLGRAARGKRVRTGGLFFEVLVVAAGKRRQLRAVLQGRAGDGDLAPLRDALATIELKRRPATPDHDVTLIDGAGDERGAANVTVGRPFTIDGITMTLRRRATIRERRHGMTFEHAPELAVVDAAGATGAVFLRDGELDMNLVAAPGATDAAELARAAGIAAADMTEVVERVGDAEWRGVRGPFMAAGRPMTFQIYVRSQRGRYVVASLMSDPAQAAAALDTARPVLASLR